MYRNLLKKFSVVMLAIFLTGDYTNSAFALDKSVLGVNDHDLFGTNRFISLEAKTDRMIYHVNQQVTITVYIKNKIDDPVELIEPAIDKRSFMIDIIAPDGKKEKMLAIYGMNLKTLELPPQKRIKFTARFIPEMAGNYNVKIRYNGYKEQIIDVPELNVFVVAAPSASLEKKDM
jgi:hypothetical protein